LVSTVPLSKREGVYLSSILGLVFCRKKNLWPRDSNSRLSDPSTTCTSVTHFALPLPLHMCQFWSGLLYQSEDAILVVPRMSILLRFFLGHSADSLKTLPQWFGIQVPACVPAFQMSIYGDVIFDYAR
jgi:hypothetical protein